jgi:hypothetical protein
MAREPRGHDWDGKAWLSDAALSRCSSDARAMWADMISLMMLSPQIGRLVGSDGTPWSDEDIVAAVRGDKPALRDALAEILRKGVASRDAANVVYCRRIVRREHEKRGLRNRVGRSRFKHKHGAAPNGDAACNGDVTPGGLGGLFSTSLEGLYPELDQILTSKSECLAQAVREWLSYKRQKRQNYKPDSLPVLLRKFEKIGERRAIAAIEHSIASNYTGLYEPADRHTGQADRLQDSLDEAERRLRGL